MNKPHFSDIYSSAFLQLFSIQHVEKYGITQNCRHRKKGYSYLSLKQ